MSDPVSALNGASFQGFAAVREMGPLGMITLRAKGLKSLDKAIKAVTGTKIPAQRRIEVNGDRACGWMSPDEYLLILPYAEVGGALASLAKSLAGEHHLAVDVSDARAVFRVEGDRAAEVLQKLSPVDFETLEPGELRRSRTAQVAAAMWKQDQGFTVVCFRSVARYVFDLLANASR
ncbi:MAG: sarcosine oxidase subunit gamma family protein [Tabrizicola sp.]|jgi:sarcosine oxidase subunit gamma|uniref:sarcosine oxidase subunit gamma n=1 Tax=Tabrizicola sp. TaxID=2005166 RepID=UPI001B4E216B|nr:sarcosine oxidase subunit gamma [Tabrizicola sp.]